MTIHRCRSRVRRLALLGAAALALGGLGSAPAARAATPPALRPPAQAPAPPFLRPTAQALARVWGYQLTVQAATAGYGSPLTATSTAVVRRHGTALRFYLTTTTHRAGQVSTLEEVLTGAHLCLRTRGRSAWACSAAPRSTLALLQSMAPDRMAQAFGLVPRYVPLGRHTRQGQACLAYRFNQGAGSVHNQGTLWIARATALPVEEDMVSTLALRTGMPSVVVRTTQRWSRWNDARLTVPSVPAS
jgi:hypothetical protein